MDNIINLAKFKSIRMSMKISQEDMARTIGISLRSYQMKESGKNEFSFKEPKFPVEEIENFTKVEELKIEKTKYGYQILPDVNNGAGPIYFCLIRKEVSLMA